VTVSSTLDRPRAPHGLNGLVVADTALGDVRGQEGFFHYRQYSGVDLAEHRSFEDVWALMIDTELPTDDRFSREVRSLRDIPAEILALLPHLAATSLSATDQLRSALSLLAGSLHLNAITDLTPSQRRHDVLRLGATLPVLAAALHRHRHGLAPVPPRHDLGHAANYLWMLNGTEPDTRHASAVEQYLILTIDHGFNNSTFTVRSVISTGADMGAAMLAGFGALTGPRHGGALSRSLDVLDAVTAAGDVTTWIRGELAAGRRIMGFGHAVYRTTDPRSEHLKSVALGLDTPRARLAVEIEQSILDELAAARPDRKLYANVEFYAGAVLESAGIPRELFMSMFTISRIIGWGAHALEQATDSKLIRPDAQYVGPPPPQPVWG
jgi:citrate synthase